MSEIAGKDSWRELWRKGVVDSVCRLLVGLSLLGVAYLAVERYRDKEAYRNIFAEKRLERLATLWSQTEKHCSVVLQKLTTKGATAATLAELGESYYEVLSRFGLFLSNDEMQSIRSCVGDAYLDSNASVLLSGGSQVRAKAIVAFRKNCLDVLEGLRKMSSTNE